MPATLLGALSSPSGTASSDWLPSVSSIARAVASDILHGFFGALGRWVSQGAVVLLKAIWRAMSSTTEPVLSGRAFSADYSTMTLIGLSTVLPLLLLATLRAIAQQDTGGLLRTVIVRLPLAVLLTGVVVGLVSLGLTLTDEWSTALLSSGQSSVGRLFDHLEAAVVLSGGIAGFVLVLLVGVVALLSLTIWVELAVRSAAVAVAALFLPLALAGLVWPATSHWARRLAETLGALVLMKLILAAVLSLTAGAFEASSGGVASLVEGVALFSMAALAPFALFRLIPLVEGSAASHLEAVRPAVRAASGDAHSWLNSHAGGNGSVESALANGPKMPSWGDLPPAGANWFGPDGRPASSAAHRSATSGSGDSSNAGSASSASPSRRAEEQTAPDQSAYDRSFDQWSQHLARRAASGAEADSSADHRGGQ